MDDTAATLDRARAPGAAGDQHGRRAVERELGGRHLARAELVLQALDADSVEPAGGVAALDVEQCEPAAARAVALGARERQRHLRRRGAREPLLAVQSPAAVGVRTRDRLRAADVRPAGRLRHPLAAGPERSGIAARQARHRALDQRVVGRREQRARGAVGHRERARVDVRDRVEQVDERELAQS
jgi:hypothetical protein